MKQWFPLVLWLFFFSWSCVLLGPWFHVVWTPMSQGVTEQMPLCTRPWPHHLLQLCGMCLLNPAAVQRDNCRMLPTSYFLSELWFSPLPTGGWDNSAQTLPGGDGSISPQSQAVGLWMNNIGMEQGEMESQCLRLFFLYIFTGLSRIAPLLPPSNVLILWQNPVLCLFWNCNVLRDRGTQKDTHVCAHSQWQQNKQKSWNSFRYHKKCLEKNVCWEEW